MIRGKFLSSWVRKGIDVVFAKNKIWFMPEGELYEPNGDYERCDNLRYGDVIEFDAGDTYVSFTRDEFRKFFDLAARLPALDKKSK
jgi:hypothetical protein